MLEILLALFLIGALASLYMGTKLIGWIFRTIGKIFK